MGDWNNLSMRDKRDVMRLHIQNGIRNLDGIMESYNQFKSGGNLYGGPQVGSNQMTQQRDAIQSYTPRDRFESIPISQEQQFNLKNFGQFNRPEQRQQTIQQPSNIKESQESKRLAEERINTRERLQKFEEQQRIDKERELKVAPYAAMGLVGAATGTLPAMIAGEIGGRTVDYGSKKLTGKSWGENVLPEAPMIGEFTNPGYIIGGLAGQYRNQIGDIAVNSAKNLETGLNKISDVVGYQLKHQYYTKAPWTYKPNPNNYYRTGYGQEFLDDVVNSRQIRASSPVEDVTSGVISIQKSFRPQDTYWSKGVPLDAKYSSYNQNYGTHVIEASNEIPFIKTVNQRLREKGFQDNPFNNYNAGHLEQQYVRPRDSYFTELDELGNPIMGTGKPIEYNPQKIKLLKPDKFFGYKEYKP